MNFSQFYDEAKDADSPFSENSNWKHFVMFYEDNEKGIFVHHLVGYETVPNEDSIKHNIEELVSDAEFGIGMKARSLSIKIVSKGEAIKIMEMMMED